jgi:lipid-binding SYLF domain-containing protein
MVKRVSLFAGALVAALTIFSSGCTTTGEGSADPELRRQALDADVDRALSQLYGQVRGSRELVATSKGVLVFPAVLSGGFIVGGSRGLGALRESGRTTGYFSMTAASVGLLAGAQSKAVFYLFMTQDALNRFKASSGWTVGADASVAVISVGANAAVDAQSIRQSVAAFVLTNGGLMANLSMDGTRIVRRDM